MFPVLLFLALLLLASLLLVLLLLALLFLASLLLALLLLVPLLLIGVERLYVPVEPILPVSVLVVSCDRTFPIVLVNVVDGWSYGLAQNWSSCP